jgi:hypothetical protein
MNAYRIKNYRFLYGCDEWPDAIIFTAELGEFLYQEISMYLTWSILEWNWMKPRMK